jgi:hypothetical protein
MKKLLILFLVPFMGLNFVYSQGNFRFGVNGGIPVGDVEDFSNFHLGTDVAYMFNVVEVLDVGPMLGYSHYFSEDLTIGSEKIETDDVQFLPIAASGRFGLSSLYLGADLGYAIGINDGNDGGFYYRPLIGYQIGKLGIAASYEGVSMDGGSFNSINLGIEFGL